MEHVKNLLDLPDQILHNIINQMNTASLINASGTCKRLFKLTKVNFQQVAFSFDVDKINLKDEQKEKFKTKLRKILRNPSKWKELFKKPPITTLKSIKNSLRKYQTFKIQNLNELSMYDEDFQKILKVFKRKGKYVKFLIVDNSTFGSTYGMNQVIKKFPNIQKIHLTNVDLKTICDHKPLALKDLLSIKIKDCPSNVARVFYGINHIERLVIHLDKVQERWNMLDIERFIFQQQKLEVLHLESAQNSLIYLHHVANALFRLKELRLRNVSFDEPFSALDFLHQQSRIQKFEVSLSTMTTKEFPVEAIEVLLKFIFEEMKQLEYLSVNCNYNEFEMNEITIKPNEKIKVLKFIMTQLKINEPLLHALLKLVPNLKRFYFKDTAVNCLLMSPFVKAEFPPIEELEIHSCFDCLNDINIPGSQLTTFKFIPRCRSTMWTMQEVFLGNFLLRHKTIKNAMLKHLFRDNFFTKIQYENLFPSLVNLIIGNMHPVAASAVKLVKFIPTLEVVDVRSVAYEDLTKYDFELVEKHKINLSQIPLIL